MFVRFVDVDGVAKVAVLIDSEVQVGKPAALQVFDRDQNGSRLAEGLFDPRGTERGTFCQLPPVMVNDPAQTTKQDVPAVDGGQDAATLSA